MATPEQRLVTEAALQPMVDQHDSHARSLEWAGYQVVTRSISNRIVSGQGWVDGAQIHYARLGGFMTLSVLNLSHTVHQEAGYKTVIELDEGYRPIIDYYFTTWQGARARALGNGRVEISRPTSTIDYFSITFPVTPADPGFRPGTPV